MKVNIWSDIRCPFCYIGKRKFEAALAQFPHKEKVEVIWHSFQLDPSLQSQPGKDVYEYLADIKGQTRDWSVRLHNQLTQTAQEVGLTFNFENAVIANSFDAHRLIQLAKKYDLADAAEERLFRAYFTEGQNISDHSTLLQLGIDIELAATEIEQMLKTDIYSREVKKDELMAQSLGVRGVPFFVINDQFGISGAQPSGTFLQTLHQAWKEYENDHTVSSLEEKEGNTCSIEGNC